MYALMVCVAVATAGIDYGWQKLPEGETQYIIQLDAQNLESLRAGKGLESDIPPTVPGVRSFLITLGNGSQKPPKDPPVFPLPEPKTPPRSQPPETLQPDAAKPLPGQQTAFFDAGKTTKPASHVVDEPPEPAKPWLPLTFTLLGLFASLGTNFYLSWIAWESRRQARAKA